MKFDSKVVDFKRSAAYVHHCALKNKRSNNSIDALELMRHAVEQSPENTEYKLDLAEMYCEMGCHAQSMRILLDLLIKPDAPNECYYGVALNQLGRNELSSARHALNAYRQNNGDREYAEDAEDLRDEIDYYRDMQFPADRRTRRAARLAEKACAALHADQAEKAIDLFEKSLHIRGDRSEMRALYAAALKIAGRESDALSQAAKSLCGNRSLRTRCTAAQVFAMCGRTDVARKLLDAVPNDYYEENELQLLVMTMGEMGMHAEAEERLRLALQDTPHSRVLLHMRATALHKGGASDARAAAFWQRILRIDPDDTIAGFYFRMASEGRLSENEPGYIYEVPDAEGERRIQRISEALAQGATRMTERWREDRTFRDLLLWAANTGNSGCMRAAVMLLAAVDDPDALGAVRELVFRGSVPTDIKMCALMLMQTRGVPEENILPENPEMSEALLPDIDELISDLPVGERQLVRLAADVLDAEYDMEAGSALAIIWTAYRKNVCDRNDPLIFTEEAAGALAWNYLLQRGEKPDAAKLAKLFGCERRRLVFYAKRLGAVPEKYGGIHYEDH